MFDMEQLPAMSIRQVHLRSRGLCLLKSKPRRTVWYPSVTVDEIQLICPFGVKPRKGTMTEEEWRKGKKRGPLNICNMEAEHICLRKVEYQQDGVEEMGDQCSME